MEYKYKWTALLKNGEILKQFDGGIENTFRLILDNIKNLKEFRLTDENNIDRYIVNMESGNIYDSDGNTIFNSPVKIGDYKFEPIFWRRNKVTIFHETKGKELVGYIIGWKALIPNDNSVVNQFLISEEGDITPLDKLGRPVERKEISARALIEN